MRMLMLCVLRLHRDCIFLSYLNVLGCQPMIYCVSINQLFVLFWSMVQLYGIITLHAQSDKLEALQKRAVRIILYPIILPYINALGYLKLESLKHRRTVADKKFFNGISMHSYNCLHHLLPPPRDTELVTRLTDCGTQTSIPYHLLKLNGFVSSSILPLQIM